MAVAAFGLAIGSTAHARLGWTLEQCEDTWGQPIKVAYNSQVGQTFYLFRAEPKLITAVYLLNGQVQSVSYLSRDGRYLLNCVREMLQKNCSGNWTVYDDHRGKQTAATWSYIDGDGTVIAYALLYNYAKSGFYSLQVSTALWDSYLRDHNVSARPSIDNLNI